MKIVWRKYPKSRNFPPTKPMASMKKSWVEPIQLIADGEAVPERV